jgi:hypothetical protein
MSRSAVVRELAPVSGSAARNTGLSSTRGAAASGCLASSKRSASRSVILSLAPSTARASIYQRASNTGSLRWAAPRLGRPGRSRCPTLKAHMPSSPTSIKVTRAGSIRLHRRQGRRRAPASALRCLHARRLSKLGLSHNGMTERPHHRISPTPARPADGLLSDHIAGVRPVRRERVFVLRRRPSPGLQDQSEQAVSGHAIEPHVSSI